MWKWRSERVPAVLAAAIAATGGAALAAGAGHQASAGSQGPRHVLKGAPAGFSVFRPARGASARTASDQEMPLAAQLEQSLGVLRASERTAGRGLWAAYSSDRLCVVFTDPIEVGHFATACALRSDANGGVVGWTSPAPSKARQAGVSEDTVQLFALMPDDVTSVTYDLPDGSSRTISPVNDGVSITLPSAPVAERVATAQGVRTQSFNTENER